jgi:hypothetical protein
VDATTKSRHAERVGDNKYWDYQECCWVRYDAALPDPSVPAQPSREQADADGATEVEPVR